MNWFEIHLCSVYRDLLQHNLQVNELFLSPALKSQLRFEKVSKSLKMCDLIAEEF